MTQKAWTSMILEDPLSPWIKEIDVFLLISEDVLLISAKKAFPH